MTVREPNLRSHPYRGLSVQHVDIPLDDASLTEYLMGREVYRRTDFLALRNGEDTCLVAVGKTSTEPLFSPVTSVEVLAGPDACRYVLAPASDVGNATALAAVATAHREPGIIAHVIEGMFSHVNFILEPAPITIHVMEVVPPEPPKLLEQAKQAVLFDEDMPPVRLELDAIEVTDLVDGVEAGRPLLLPCRGAGTDLGREVAYLDTRPAERLDWTMVGCDRSSQFHEHFYGDMPPVVGMCPLRRLPDDGSGPLTLAKCCMIERGVDLRDGVAIVPWGANLDEVRLALRSLVGLDAVEEITVTTVTSETTVASA